MVLSCVFLFFFPLLFPLLFLIYYLFNIHYSLSSLPFSSFFSSFLFSKVYFSSFSLFETCHKYYLFSFIPPPFSPIFPSEGTIIQQLPRLCVPRPSHIVRMQYRSTHTDGHVNLYVHALHKFNKYGHTNIDRLIRIFVFMFVYICI